ncbi:MAG: Fur family transcriptional regulator [Acidimicrobiia bacterium]
MTSTSLDREVEKRLGEHEIRYTRGRRVVVSALAASDGPRSAAELHDEIGPAVPLSSLYRSLAILEEAGVVIPHHGARTLTRYELAEWLAGHHHHLVCIVCGSVEDVEIPRRHEAEVRGLVDDISAAASFVPINHALEIEGRCVKCA